MKEKIKTIQRELENDPKFQEALGRLKPQWNLWGIAGVVFFFFLPELITAIWQKPLVAWTHLHTLTEPFAPMRGLYAMLESIFADGVSWVNIGLGVVLLWWAAKSR